jgi:hypothetical protein
VAFISWPTVRRVLLGVRREAEEDAPAAALEDDADAGKKSVLACLCRCGLCGWMS